MTQVVDSDVAFDTMGIGMRRRSRTLLRACHSLHVITAAAAAEEEDNEPIRNSRVLD